MQSVKGSFLSGVADMLLVLVLFCIHTCFNNSAPAQQDIWRGQLNGKLICCKVLRVYEEHVGKSVFEVRD